MDIRIVIVIIGLLAGGAAYAQAYTWTDEDGVVHYSDRPRPGATEVDLGQYSAPSAAPRRPVRRSAPVTTRDDEPEVFSYESLVVASPEAEQTLWNIGGVMTVSLALSPALQPGHRVRVYYDGNPREVAGLSFQLQEVYRGAHNLQAEVLDENGSVMIRSQPSRFYVQQTSILRR
ncbi:MAG: DUF4124 domain-containing protein [Gammaproteobacteria bacterium]|nr:DUF4124 domain-containing protein [Gammaproteobacteria bacterium]